VRKERELEKAKGRERETKSKTLIDFEFNEDLKPPDECEKL